MTDSLYMPDVKVEVAFNAGVNTPAASRTWTDVSPYVELDRQLVIGYGRSDQFATADANSLRLTLDNSDGRFTPEKSSSPYYPNVKIGRPIRVTAVNPPTPSFNLLSANAASMETSIADWTTSGTPVPTLSQSSVRAWSGTKSLLITWQGSGGFPQGITTVSGLTIGLAYTASFYVYVPTGSANVIPVFATTTGPTYTLKDGWNRISVTHTATATSHSIGIRGSGPGVGDTCWVDAVMVNQGTTPGEFNTTAQTTSTRYLGYVDEWPTAWDKGVDAYAASNLSASSRLARLGTGRTLRSIIEEEYLLDAPAMYYTLGEPAGSLLANDSSGKSARALSMVDTGTAVVFGNATGPGTDGLTAAEFAFLGKSLLAADLNVPLTAGWVEIVFSTSSNSITLIDTTTLQLNIAANKVQGIAGGVAILSGSTVTDGLTHHALIASANGGPTTLYLDGVQVGTDATSVTLATITALGVGGHNGVTSGPGSAGVMTLAHAALGVGTMNATRAAAHANAALNGFAGETPAARLTRYAAYGGAPAAELSLETGMVPDLAHIFTTGKTVVDVMREVETTEEGVLFDSRAGLIAFHARNHRYSAASAFTLIVSSQQVEADLEPKYDRTTILNDVSATGATGVTAHVIVTTSRDDYGTADKQLTLATTNVDEPLLHASWLANQYNQPRFRFSTVGVMPLPLGADVLASLYAADVGTRFTLAGQPAQMPAASSDYFIEGCTETYDDESVAFTFNVSPAAPFVDVWTVEDAVLGQYDAYPIAY